MDSAAIVQSVRTWSKSLSVTVWLMGNVVLLRSVASAKRYPSCGRSSGCPFSTRTAGRDLSSATQQCFFCRKHLGPLLPSPLPRYTPKGLQRFAAVFLFLGFRLRSHPNCFRRRLRGWRRRLRPRLAGTLFVIAPRPRQFGRFVGCNCSLVVAFPVRSFGSMFVDSYV